jgi:hypothetical protein
MADMRTKLSLEIYESEVLRSIISESKEETFGFIEKILHSYEAPTEIALELQNHLEQFIENYQRNEYDEFVFNDIHNKPKKKIKRAVDHKPSKIVDDKPEYIYS